MASSATFPAEGFHIVRGLLDRGEVERYRSLLIERSGVDPATHRADSRGRTSWNHTDGVTKDDAFWDLITHERLREEVADCIGPDFRYLQHSDLQVGFSAVAWHRDNVNRTYGVGPDWDESDGPYGLVRVGVYLQEYAASGFRLGFIPGSHRFESGGSTLRRRVREAGFQVVGGLAYLGPRFQNLSRAAQWVATEPGDAIVFDPRILHSGSWIDGLKLSMFVGYGVENRHFADLHNYYRHVRTELGYGDIPDALAAKLDSAGLLPSDVPASADIPHMYVPAAPIRRLVAGRTSRS